MKVRPITINGNESLIEFNSCKLDEITVITGGYIITPSGEIIIVDEKDEHCNVFSAYINMYLEEKESSKTYDTSTAMKILCNIGCCVYSGIRYHEYISSKTETFDNEAITLAFPQQIEEITPIQKEICKKLIESNKSVLGNREKTYMAYESYPDIVYTKEQVMSILNKSKPKEKGLKDGNIKNTKN